MGAIVQSDGPIGQDELTAAQVVLRRLVSKQEPAGDYVATLVRDTGRPEVHFAFSDEGDARKFAAAVKADAIGSHPGWASQRAFELPSEKLASLEASLPAPRDNPRQREADGPRLMRRGPRQSPLKRYDEEE